MYIKNAKIWGFIPFDTFGIKRVTINAESIVQILIGDNGCGKSMLLKELNPLPSAKSLYHRGGGKQLIIHHRDGTYEISSTFEKKSGTHSFIKDGTELNIDHTSTLQQELAATHLGYTSRLHNFLTCKYNICQMGVAERKALIMSLSPTTPRFIIDMHQYARNVLRGCKNNLSMLYQRKQEIEESLLSEDDLLAASKEKDKIDKAVTDVTNRYYHATRLYEDKLQKMPLTESPGMEYITDKVKQLKNVAIRLRNMHPRNLGMPLEEQEAHWKTIIQTCNTTVQEITKRGKACTDALLEFDNNLATLTEDACVGKFKSELEEKTKLRDAYKATLNELLGVYTQALTPEEMETTKHAKSQVFALLVPLIDDYHQDSFLPLDQVYTKKTKYNELCYAIQKHIAEIGSIQQELVKIQEQLTGLPSEPRTILDNCNTCGYHTHYATMRNDLTVKQTELQKRLNIVTTEKESFSKNAVTIKAEIDRHDRETEILNKVYALCRGTIFHQDLENLRTGLQSVSLYLSKMDHVYDVQPQIAEYYKLVAEIEDAVQKLKTMENANAPTIKVLRDLREKKLQERAITLKELLACNRKQAEAQRALEIIQQYQALEASWIKAREVLETEDTFRVRSMFKDFVQNTYLPALQKEKSTLDTQLYNVNKIIREQTSLRERYNKEILTMITNTEKKKELYEYLEWSLSPEHGLPHFHLVSFVNSIIGNANFVLSKIWTTPLEIQPISDDEEFNCAFMVRCNGNQLNKIDSLSKGQTAAVNFAWYIALQITMDTKEYPCIFDECDENLDAKHKQNYLEWLKLYIDEGYATQMWVVNHDAALYTGFMCKDIICLRDNNVVTPTDINVQAEIEYT